MSSVPCRDTDPVQTSVPIANFKCTMTPQPSYFQFFDEQGYSENIYEVGLTLQITSHRPPLPFGCPQYRHNTPKESSPDPAKSESLLDYVFRVHPIRTECEAKPRKAALTIEKQLSSSKSFGSRVFACMLDSKAAAGYERVLAKIYDPLYYAWLRTSEGPQFHHVVRHADVDYSREAAAYEYVHGLGHDGSLTPEYYGSWTFTVTASQGKSRPVRLVLTEYIDGPTLYQAYFKRSSVSSHGRKEWLPPNEQPDLPDKVRLDIFAEFLTIWARQWHIGLNQKDFAPRNVIALLDTPHDGDMRESRVKRVVLIDYNVSIVFKTDSSQTKPRNPMEGMWKHPSVPEWNDWLPKRWSEKEGSHREWLWQTFGRPDVLEDFRPIQPETWIEIQTWLKAREGSSAKP